MLAYILAVAVFSISLALFAAAFAYQEVHKKHDFLLSGLGLFYGLVLWVCAGRITGGVLLGQLIVVSLLGYFVWETIKLRKAVANPDRLVEIANFSLFQWTNKKLASARKSSIPKAPPLKTEASIITEKDEVQLETSPVKDLQAEIKDNLAQTEEAIAQKVDEVKDVVKEKAEPIADQASEIANEVKDEIDQKKAEVQAQESPVESLKEVQNSVVDKSKELAQQAQEKATVLQEEVETTAAKIQDSTVTDKLKTAPVAVKTSISVPSKPEKKSLLGGLFGKIKNIGKASPPTAKDNVSIKQNKSSSPVIQKPIPPTSDDDFDFDEVEQNPGTPGVVPVEKVTEHIPPTTATVIQEPDSPATTTINESSQNPDTPAFLPVEEVTEHIPPTTATVIQEPDLEDLEKINLSKENQEATAFAPVEEVTQPIAETLTNTNENNVASSVENPTVMGGLDELKEHKGEKTESITVQIVEYPATKGSKLMEIQVPKNDEETSS